MVGRLARAGESARDGSDATSASEATTRGEKRGSWYFIGLIRINTFVYLRLVLARLAPNPTPRFEKVVCRAHPRRYFSRARPRARA